MLVMVQRQLGFLGHDFPASRCAAGSTPLRCSAWRSTPVVASARRHRPRSRTSRREPAAGVMSTDSGRRPSQAGVTSGSRQALKIVLPILATLAILAPLAWLWQGSRVPAVYSVMDMGHHDYGGGAAPDAGGGHGGHAQGHVHHSEPSRLITDLVVDPARPQTYGSTWSPDKY